MLLTRGPATQAGLAPVELVVAILRSAGLSSEHALAGMQVLMAAVRGYAAIIATGAAHPEQRHAEELIALASPEELPCLSEAAAHPHKDLNAQFEFGFRAITAGLLGAEGA